MMPEARATETSSADGGPLPWRVNAGWAAVVALIAADVVAWMFCTAVVVGAALAFHEELDWASVHPWLLVPWIAFRSVGRLYPAIGLPPTEEVRRSFLSALAIGFLDFVSRIAAGGAPVVAILMLLPWLMVPFVVHFTRAFARVWLRRRQLFGIPVIILGSGTNARRAIREMITQPELGLVPVGCFGDEVSPDGSRQILGIPILASIEQGMEYDFPYVVRHGMMALSPREAGPTRLLEVLNLYTERLPRMYLFPSLVGLANLSVRPLALGSYCALSVSHLRFSSVNQFVKRSFDLLFAVPITLLVLPIIAICAILVKFNSPGPAFFSQVREGRNGAPIRVFKLRTMVPNAGGKLREYLAQNPEAEIEYERTLKLRNDPRIIPRVGSLLRRASLDELPQLFGVLAGTMSLVGPRVMPRAEVDRFSLRGQRLRRDVPPGITGLWQVSHRNNGDLRIREVADSYYVDNWSIWMDLWILLRTVRVVLGRQGAY